MKKYCLWVNSFIIICFMLAGCDKSTANVSDDKPKERIEQDKDQETAKDNNAQPSVEIKESSENSVSTEENEILQEDDRVIDNADSTLADDEGEPYCGVLYWYKELQDSGKNWEEMEEYNSQTGLVQHGWPYASNNDEIRYVYQDITGDGFDELIVTYYNEPVDIYANEGDAVYAYGVPYRAVSSFFPGGYIKEDVTLGVKGFQTIWYKFDDTTHKYIPTKEEPKMQEPAIIFPEGKRIADVVR